MVQGDWSGLIERWERDKVKRSEKITAVQARRPNIEDSEADQKEMSRQRKLVIGLIEAGQLGKAMSRVNSHGLGNIRDPTIKAQLTEKFPPRQRILPKSVTRIRPIDSFRDLRTALLSLSSGTSPGSGGLRNEYLTALGEDGGQRAEATRGAGPGLQCC